MPETLVDGSDASGADNAPQANPATAILSQYGMAGSQDSAPALSGDPVVSILGSYGMTPSRDYINERRAQMQSYVSDRARTSNLEAGQDYQRQYEQGTREGFSTRFPGT